MISIIPFKFPIGGLEYEVKLVDREEISLGEETVLGRIYYQDLQVLVADDLPLLIKDRAFVHEMLHAIFRGMGVEFQEVIVDEQFIDNASYFLHQAIRSIVSEKIGEFRHEIIDLLKSNKDKSVEEIVELIEGNLR